MLTGAASFMHSYQGQATLRVTWTRSGERMVTQEKNKVVQCQQKNGESGTGKHRRYPLYFKIQMRHACMRDRERERERQRHRKHSVNSCGRFDVLSRFWCTTCTTALIGVVCFIISKNFTWKLILVCTQEGLWKEFSRRRYRVCIKYLSKRLL